jgi:predicted nucleic acid-binding protein
VLPIDEIIVQEATKLRQLKNLSIGDAIIAATGIIHNLSLITRNIKDFSTFPNLTLINPIL